MAPWLVLLLWLSGADRPPAREPVAAPATHQAAAPEPRRAELTIRYAVQVRGTDAGRFRRTAHAVLADRRGWSLGGRIRFQRVRRDPDFTLFLASPAALPALGCWDTNYSCRAGDRVVVNARRWREGASAWRGSLSAYRTMVVNHEVGHWLGFGHDGCRAGGRRAPVMMQQSMGTGPCKPNPWPLAAERAGLRARMLGGRVR